MRISEVEYLREREGAERAAAERTTGPSRDAHIMMANRYAQRIAIIEESWAVPKLS